MSHAELAVLSLLVEQPRHGYDIEQVIDERGMRDWTEIGFSSIYYLLKKLEEAGAVQGRLEPAAGRGPARKVYRVTAAGRAAWQAATLEVLSTPARQPAPLLQGLANLPGISLDDALGALARYREQLEQRREAVAARRQQAGGAALPLFVAAMFDYSETMIEAESAWVEGFREQLVQQGASAVTVEPG